MFLASNISTVLPAASTVSTEMNRLKPLTLVEKYTKQFENIFLVFGPRLLISIVILLIGWWLIRVVVKGLNRIMLVRDIDPTLRPFLKSLISISLKVMLVLSVASQIGIQTTSFVAAMGAAGLAIGLALQGSLANFAGGILILVFKPFKVGDFIGTSKYEGTVSEIQILYTILNTIDYKKVVIPNGILSNNEVVNFTSNENRRVDLKIHIAYSSNLLEAKKILEDIVAFNDLILKDPAPVVGVAELTDNAIGFNVWIWVRTVDYALVKHQVFELTKLAFDKSGIKAPWGELEAIIGKKPM